MSKQVKRERKREHFYRLAKHKGYRSRAAFKLKQLNRRYGLLHKGDVVVDLGAAPGGWLQVARECVGAKGFVLGLDLQPITKLPYDNVVTLRGDLTDPAMPGLIHERLPRSANVVLSDASPKISGVWNVDHVRSIELARAVLAISDSILCKGGRLVVKVFQGELFNDLMADIRQRFDFAKISKPIASRKRSAEVYIIAKGFTRR
jgi:23S rRNA (uridine2552-2'-O)-methyltransferase